MRDKAHRFAHEKRLEATFRLAGELQIADCKLAPPFPAAATDAQIGQADESGDRYIEERYYWMNPWIVLRYQLNMPKIDFSRNSQTVQIASPMIFLDILEAPAARS